MTPDRPPQNDVDAHVERLRTNYSTVGAAVMQAMYSDGYLSIGGTASTDELARKGGVSSTSQVLDIGCGVGGPAVHLAKTTGCSIVGIDLVETNVVAAQTLAATHGVDRRASFQHGDATALPIDGATFDVVWGQDAWCHVPDKAALIAEAARVLRPGGTVAFTDWLDGSGMSEVDRVAALEAAVSPNAATAGEYLSLLEQAGFESIEHEDISATFVHQYREICAGLNERRSELTAQFGERVYDIVADVNTTILRGFEGGAIGGGRFIAHLPLTEPPTHQTQGGTVGSKHHN